MEDEAWSLDHCAKQAAALPLTFADLTNKHGKLEFKHVYKCEENHFHFKSSLVLD
jgi:hypothetical protein